MKLLQMLRKGLGYVLLCMGVSRPAPAPQPENPASGASKNNASGLH